ncbi:MAG: UDP-N-acetylmuramoyl-tripeptide--D-alanyl-D-alanine ligase [Acidimicrobiales bacterium]
MRFSTREVAEVTGGVLHGPDVLVSGAAVDSRLITGGELFIPLRAERDGHAFIDAAIGAGAAAYLTEEPPRRGIAVTVDDTWAAMTALASHARDRAADAVAIGVTGSVGKTTTKDMIRAVLAPMYTTHASTRSYNNEIGVPLTLLGAPEDAGAVVVELGARARGDIAALCRVARPSIGVVTRVAPVHTESFGDIDEVARAKRELVEALPPQGTAVLNADDQRVAAMAEVARGTVVWFGTSGDGDVRAEVLDLDEELRPRARFTTPGGTIVVRLSARGAHQVQNAAAAVAVALACHVQLPGIAEALERAEMSPQRMSLSVNERGVRVLDDSYNANPASVEAALRSLADLPARRRVAVLGFMAELGAMEAPEHERMANVAARLGIEVIAVDAPQYGVDCLTPDEVVDRLAGLGDGDAVLVKGSRVVGLDGLAATLRALG